MDKSESGFMLVETLVTLALIMVVMMAIVDSSVLQSKVQVNSTSDSAISSLFDQVQGIAGAEWSCTAGLAGSIYSGTLIVKDPVNLTPVASEGSGSGKFWTLTRVRMQNVQAVPGQAGVLRGSLFLQANKNMALNLGNPIISRAIPDIYFETNPDGTIARCYTTSDTASAGQSACQLLGGTWLPSASSPSHCQLPTTGG